MFVLVYPKEDRVDMWLFINKKIDDGSCECRSIEQNNNDAITEYTGIDYDYSKLEQFNTYGIKDGVIAIIQPENDGLVFWKDYDMVITMHKV